jgi:DNA-binding response OmpR family regulator
VKQSGGSIFVYSEVGRGTTFKIYLPRDASAEGPVTRKPHPGAVAARGETILLVEDDASVREVTRRVLAGAGYEVLVATSGSDGLLASERHDGRIHLLLTDVVMPQMSGKVLAERLSAARPGLKVLYMSGYTDNAIVHHGVLDAGTDFIGKPFSQEGLLAKVREILDGIET